MLVIQFPDGEERRDKRRRQVRRALGYMLAGTLITAGLLIAVAGLPRTWWPGTALLGLEAWWFWAILTDPVLRERLPRLPGK